ncbi:MAG: preprotein translocase subunit SecA, partial [Bacteroidia bacterium]
MSFINTLARKFFGSKADKDIEEIQPYVAIIDEISKTLKNISDDQLRGKT